MGAMVEDTYISGIVEFLSIIFRQLIIKGRKAALDNIYKKDNSQLRTFGVIEEKHTIFHCSFLTKITKATSMISSKILTVTRIVTVKPTSN